MGITFQNYFENRVNELLENTQELTLFIFRGFGIKQIKYLVHHRNSILDSDDIIADNKLQINTLNQKARVLNRALMLAEHSLVGFYEELITISSILKDISASFDGRVIIIENDLFNGPVPCCIDQNIAEKIFDYLQSDKPKEAPELDVFLKYYSDVKALPNHKSLLYINNVHKDLDISSIGLFKKVDSIPGPVGSGKDILIGTDNDILYRLSLVEDSEGSFSSVNIKRDINKNKESAEGLLRSLGNLGIPYSVTELNFLAPKHEYDEKPFYPYLSKYWGSLATFRKLQFYSDPGISKNIKEISQGILVSEIVEQCELAKDGEEFRDIFITAPTGAGKSLLFQLPAIYLAERYNLVTIVISPLIALMNDQVAQLERERGVKIATCINSSITFDERQKQINEIKAGRKSIVYLAPELLLATGLKTLLGDRKLGLLVIDEAHTITSWGRDFRSDYWFLGDYLRMLRRDNEKFPVVCLTATAVYSGPDDVVDDTITELNLNSPILHLGNVKRSNIKFNIRDCKLEEGKPLELTKRQMLIKRLVRYTMLKERTLAYCPYRSQVEQIYTEIDEKYKGKIRRYYGGLYREEKNITEKEYRNGTVYALVCTKAFGMGVDRSDIKNIIHFAPTGSLSDYVQEIGRAGRDPSITAIAHMDYFAGDMRYVRTLYGISEMKQFQLKAILKKLSDIYHVKKNRNLLIAPESFSHLFNESQIETKVKSGLLMLAKDLRETYGFPVLIVRPRVMLTRMYISVPDSLRTTFLNKYGQYSKTIGKMPDLIVTEANGVETKISYPGTVYSIRIGDLWENEFSDLSFGSFKWKFFSPDFMMDEKGAHIVPRVKVSVKYHADFETVKDLIEKLLDTTVKFFNKKKSDISKTFGEKEFIQEITAQCGEKILEKKDIELYLDMLTLQVREETIFDQNRSLIKVLQKRKKPGEGNESEYVILGNYTRLQRGLMNLLYQCRPNYGEEYSSYVPYVKDKAIGIIHILNLLEITGLASYELHGGERAEIFVRINDPDKIDRLANGKYKNLVLQEIRRKHQTSLDLLRKFFTCKMTDEDRWSFIESYFLGRMEEIEYYLNKYGDSLNSRSEAN